MPGSTLEHNVHRKNAKRQRGSKAPTTKPKARSLSLRIDYETRNLIDRAAGTIGQTRTDFMLTSARERAIDVLLNQRLFVLSADEWNAFVVALDNPPPPNAKLKALLAGEAPWEIQE